jgi:TfoX/Sxy family transcriptional regulator of competence genes
MPYNTQLSDRIREKLSSLNGKVVEKHMFGGVCFMVNDKMCAGVVKDDMMCRIGPAAYESALEEPGCREMLFTGRPMKGYVFVDAPTLASQKALNKWLDLCLAYNSEAKASAKKRGRRLSGRKTG